MLWPRNASERSDCAMTAEHPQAVERGVRLQVLQYEKKRKRTLSGEARFVTGKAACLDKFCEPGEHNYKRGGAPLARRPRHVMGVGASHDAALSEESTSLARKSFPLTLAQQRFVSAARRALHCEQEAYKNAEQRLEGVTLEEAIRHHKFWQRKEAHLQLRAEIYAINNLLKRRDEKRYEEYGRGRSRWHTVVHWPAGEDGEAGATLAPSPFEAYQAAMDRAQDEYDRTTGGKAATSFHREQMEREREKLLLRREGEAARERNELQWMGRHHCRSHTAEDQGSPSPAAAPTGKQRLHEELHHHRATGAGVLTRDERQRNVGRTALSARVPGEGRSPRTVLFGSTSAGTARRSRGHAAHQLHTRTVPPLPPRPLSLLPERTLREGTFGEVIMEARKLSLARRHTGVRSAGPAGGVEGASTPTPQERRWFDQWLGVIFALRGT
jgi:hypothetical protein